MDGGDGRNVRRLSKKVMSQVLEIGDSEFVLTVRAA